MSTRSPSVRPLWLGFLALLLLMSVLVLSISFTSAQSDTTTQATPTLDPIFTFDVEGEIGRALPRRLIYDSVGEQYAIVDAYNTLSISDALTYRTRFRLAEQTEIVDLAFSHDGRWLAAINGLNVELWNTETGELAASLNAPGDPRRLVGPLSFSSEDEVLVFYGEYPAPQALRRSENDRVTYPWVWHLPAARGESASTLPDGVTAQVLYDYSNGFILTPDDQIIAALPSRLRVLNALTLETNYEIPTDHYEQEPLTIWTSLRDNRVYVFSASSNTLLQVDMAQGTLSALPLDQDIAPGSLESLTLGSISQPIGSGDLRSVLLDRERYRSLNRAEITLVDLLQPPTTSQNFGSMVPLLHYQLGRTERFTFATYNAASQYALSPDGSTLVLRRQDINQGDEYVIRYDIATGDETSRLLPTLRSIGGYNRSSQNRILAFDQAGDTILSDFQRVKADDLTVVSDDLRYSFQFDRFFFGRESGTMVTFSGTEWRLWDIPTNTVLRREIIERAESIRATSSDGYRILTDTGDALGVQDFDTNEYYQLAAPRMPAGSSLILSETIPNPTWTRLLAVYSDHPTGPYSPGGALAVVDQNGDTTWLIAGDDLPSPISTYGWIDDETVYVSGGGDQSTQARIYGVDYAPNGLPQCLLDTFSDQTPDFLARWQRLLLVVRADRLNEFVLRLCDQLPASAADVIATLVPTNTPDYSQSISANGEPVPTIPGTPLPEGAIPACLLQRFPTQIESYSALWRDLSADLAPQQVQELAVLLCEGIGVIPTPNPSAATPTPDGSFAGISQSLVMFIDAETGERGLGSYTQLATASDPLIPIRPIYEQRFERPMGTALMSADHQLLAVSNLPGELTIYRLGFPYERAGVPLTATAEMIRTQQNLIYPVSSPGPTLTPQPVGTARPTLTITPSQTLFPRPPENVLPTTTPGGFVESLSCSTNTLHSISSPPLSYAPTGSIYALFSDGPTWEVQPEDGTRAESPNAPQCERGLTCQFSPDRAWILAQTYELVYVTRPDNSDQRILWDLRTPNPPTPFPRNLHWSGTDTLEWEGPFPIGATPEFTSGIIRDTLNVYPDPAPFLTAIHIDGIPASFVSRQPGGDWVVAQIEYGTGTSYGYRYYLVNTAAAPLVYQEATETTSGYGYYDASTVNGNARLFAQDRELNLSIRWSPFGDRLYFSFQNQNAREDPYEMVFPEGLAEASRNTVGSGEYSPDGRYLANFLTSENRAPSLTVTDVVLGERRNYCLPETSITQSSPEGLIVRWSPDSRYMAVQVVLRRDGEEHVLIVDRETGEVVDLTSGVYQLITWGQEPGSYPVEAGTTLIPTPTLSTPTPSPAGG